MRTTIRLTTEKDGMFYLWVKDLMHGRYETYNELSEAVKKLSKRYNELAIINDIKDTKID